MDFSAEKATTEREALKSTIRSLNTRLSRKDAEVISLKSQLALLSSPMQVQLTLLDQDLQSLLSAASSRSESQGGASTQKVVLLERRNRELQERCDEYYEELVELRRAHRRTEQKDGKRTLQPSRHTERREHNRMRSSYL